MSLKPLLKDTFAKFRLLYAESLRNPLEEFLAVFIAGVEANSLKGLRASSLILFVAFSCFEDVLSFLPLMFRTPGCEEIGLVAFPNLTLTSEISLSSVFYYVLIPRCV